jgi:hypothetical protein
LRMIAARGFGAGNCSQRLITPNGFPPTVV